MDGANVDWSTIHPLATPATTPPRYIARWAGVQKLSLPIVMCHEISQMTPMTMLVAPNRAPYRCHGTVAARATVRGRVVDVDAIVAVPMCLRLRTGDDGDGGWGVSCDAANSFLPIPYLPLPSSYGTTPPVTLATHNPLFMSLA